MTTRGFTIVEVLVAGVILALLLGSLYQVFRSGSTGARAALQSHLVNEAIQLVTDVVGNDVKEACALDPDHPPMVIPGAETSLRTDGPENRLVLYQLRLDFRKDPDGLRGDERFYAKTVIEFSVEPDAGPDGTFSLIRTTTPLDFSGKPQDAMKKRKVVASQLGDAVFFRYKEPGGPGESQALPTGKSVFLKLRMSRRDAPSSGGTPYSVEWVSAFRIRGSDPEGF